MPTFTLSTRYLALLLVVACGEVARPKIDAGPDGAPPIDAPPDAPPPDPGLQRLNWRTTRGAPIATSSVIVPTAELFAVSRDGFVTRSACQDNPDASPSCTFIWHDRAGAPGVRRERLTNVTSTVASPDGLRALLVALDAFETCDNGQIAFQVARGALQLLDLATGAASFDQQLRTNLLSATAFTPLSDFFFFAPIQGTACLASSTGLRSVASPFAPPPGLATTDELGQVVDARRWLVARGSDELGLADPLTADSFRSFRAFADDANPFADVSQSWVHVYLGFSNLAQDVVSISPTGSTRQAVLRDQDWFPFGARGRWFRVCGLLQQAEGYRNCRVVDGQGQTPPANFRATFADDHPDDAVLLDRGAVVFVGPTENGSRAVQRITLATGRLEILHPGNGTLRSLGDGAAALLLRDGAAWLIEAEREELLVEGVTHVVSAPRIPLPGRLPGRQDDVAGLVVSSGTGPVTLALLDVRSRRLATVTDNLFFTRPPGPFSFGDGCGQPWTTRNAGRVIEGFFQRPQHLFFVEEGTPATLWMVPIDLSAPPRRLAELPGGPTSCHAPLTSPDGRRIGFAENGADGTTTRITLSSEN